MEGKEGREGKEGEEGAEGMEGKEGGELDACPGAWGRPGASHGAPSPAAH